MSETAVDPNIIRRTQDTLGKIISTPSLTNARLSRPPILFLQDIVREVVKKTGFLQGLYTEEELSSAYLRDRDSKTLFIKKLVTAVYIAVKRPRDVRVSKIIAGLEPEKTNVLLQNLAEAINANVNNQYLVKKTFESLDQSKDTSAKVHDILESSQDQICPWSSGKHRLLFHVAQDTGKSMTQRILRITDVAQEPLEYLSPIGGYERMPIVSLEEAVKDLLQILPTIQSHVYVVKQRCIEPADGLTSDESAAIMLYTMEWEPLDQCLYTVLNATLRLKDRQKLKPWFLYLRLLLNGLFKLPTVATRTVFRGVKLDLTEDYRIDKIIVWWGFSSCTGVLHVLQSDSFLGKTSRRTLFNIECYSAKDIREHSYFPSEDEFLLLPGTQFKVIGRLDQGELQIVHLKEERPPHPLLQPMPVKK